jgi:thiol:disulfide interchange protein
MKKQIFVQAVAAVLLCNLFVTAQQAGRKRTPQLTTEDVLRGKGASRTTVIADNVPGTGASAGVPITTSWFSGADGYALAVREQQQTGAPMAVYFYTDWCGYCKRLERNVLSTGEVESYFSSKLIRVKVNPEDGPAEDALGRQYAVTGYPSFFIVRASVPRPQKIRPYKRQSGTWVPMGPSDFIAALEQAAQ